MRGSLITILVMLILSLSIYNAWKDQGETHDHKAFFDDVRVFMSRGGRNTSDMGLDLCKRLVEVELAIGKPPINCEDVYIKEVKK